MKYKVGDKVKVKRGIGTVIGIGTFNDYLVSVPGTNSHNGEGFHLIDGHHGTNGDCWWENDKTIKGRVNMTKDDLKEGSWVLVDRGYSQYIYAPEYKERDLSLFNQDLIHKYRKNDDIVKVYKLEEVWEREEKHEIVIDGKTIELSEESYNNIKEALK